MPIRIILHESSYPRTGSRSEIDTEGKHKSWKKAFFVIDREFIKFGAANNLAPTLHHGLNTF
jgi:alcohol dehydrogenase class IV